MTLRQVGWPLKSEKNHLKFDLYDITNIQKNPFTNCTHICVKVIDRKLDTSVSLLFVWYVS